MLFAAVIVVPLLVPVVRIPADYFAYPHRFAAKWRRKKTTTAAVDRLTEALV
jgi:hypothetical protein